ncbi:MAG: PqqD family protein [Armatimonadota bacterium]|nr:MAG: PqqD family protein [Armatimonadota bacterium]
MRLGRRQPKLSKERALASYPMRNQAVEWSSSGEETVIVMRRREDWVGRLLSLFFVVPKERKLQLDRVGSYVWQGCDGQHTVAELIERLAAKYKLNRKEAEVSLTAFLRQLGKRKLIAIAVPQQDARAAKERKLRDVGADNSA